MAAKDLPETARGEADHPREPDLNMTYTDLPAGAAGKGKKWDRPVDVPVWFHIVHDNGIGNVSDEDVIRQIRIMNQGQGVAPMRKQPSVPEPQSTLSLNCPM